MPDYATFARHIGTRNFGIQRFVRCAAAALFAGPLLCGAAQAQSAGSSPASAQGGIALELNKLEPAAGAAPGCRVYFLVSNPDSEPFEQLQLDLILFATDGVIARRVGLELGPLPPKKQGVRLFDATGLACPDIGKILINDVIACTHKAGATSTEAERAACLDRMTLTSRAKAPLTK